MDYAAGDQSMLELLQTNGGKPGIEIYTPPSPVTSPSPPPPPPADEDQAQETNKELKEEVGETEEKDEEEQKDEEDESEIAEDSKQTPSVIKKVTRPIHSRPTSGMEVFDHMTPDLPPSAKEERFPTRKPSVLSRAMSLIRQKSPPPDSIRSSMLGLYAAHATMVAAAVIGT